MIITRSICCQFAQRRAAVLCLPAALLVALLCILNGCARLEKPVAEKPGLPLILSEKHEIPEFSDDMLYDGLAVSIAGSLSYFRTRPAETRFLFGEDVYSAGHMVASLQRFADFIKKKPDLKTLNRFITEQYHVYRSIGGPSNGDMLFTGYYEPFLRGSTHKNSRYRFPIYTRPSDLVSIDLGPFSDRFKGETIWGRFSGNTVVPYHDRQAIDSTGVLEKKSRVIAWVDDRIDLFFLHIQGSGKIYMDTGAPLNVHYNSPNGKPYRSIGKLLIDNGTIDRKQMSMQAIKAYLRANPDMVDTTLNANPSYVFFNTEKEGPIGSIGVTLTPGRAIATDRRIFPKGALAFIQSHKPLVDGNGTIRKWSAFSRFVLNQDTGGAIRGPGRADLFWGNGPYAELAAGYMQHPGTLYFLVLKPDI